MLESPMQHTSEVQYASFIDGQLPAFDEVRDSVWSLPLRIPRHGPPYTLSYLIVDHAGDVHIVDPGLDLDTNWDRLTASLGTIGRAVSDVASVIITHLHPDHLGMADRLKAASGARVAIHRAEQEAIDGLRAADHSSAAFAVQLDVWGVPTDVREQFVSLPFRPGDWPEFSADVLFDDGEALDVPGRELRVIRTPGHTPGHACLRDVDESLLYTGDHVLPAQFPGLGLGGVTATNPIADYLTSLETLAPFDDHEVLPGHGYRFRGLAGRCAETAAHHGRRTDEVESALAKDADATVWQVASGLTWTNGWTRLGGFTLQSALAQTAMHADFVRTRR